MRELVLHDVDEERREIVGGLARRMLDRQGFEGSLEVTGELERALDGADFVLVQIRVGGQAARLSRRDDPARLRLHRPGDDRRGRARKALRTVPVVLGIAERVRALAADGAWIVDFTNPVGIVTRALLDDGHRAVGLCNVAITLQRFIRAAARRRARASRSRPGRTQPPDVGARGLGRRRGRAAGAARTSTATSSPRTSACRPAAATSSAWCRRRTCATSTRTTSSSPSSSTACRAPQAVAEIERELLELYRDPELAEKPPLLEQRGGAYYSEAATGLVASLASGDDEVHVVDVRNGGTLAGLAADDVVEVPARVDRAGPVALPQRAARARAARARPARRRVRAARGAGGRDAGTAATARKALLAHPLIGQQAVEQLVERLLEADASTCRSSAVRCGMSDGLVLAVDGGNSKTDLALVRADGEVLALVRGPQSSPHHLGLDGCLAVLDGLLGERGRRGGARPPNGAVAEVGELLLAGVDFPAEEQALYDGASGRGWARATHGPQRHVRDPACRHRARLGRRGRLRRRDQLRRRRPGRPARALPLPRRDHRRLGRRLRPRPGRASRRRPAARTAAARARASSEAFPPTSASRPAASSQRRSTSVRSRSGG